MNCTVCKKRLSLAKTIQLRNGRVLNILQCRACGHTQLDALVASA